MRGFASGGECILKCASAKVPFLGYDFFTSPLQDTVQRHSKYTEINGHNESCS